MNGAEALVRTLAASGVELCLGNPGTSEIHFVAALDGEPRLRAVLGLFEGVVTGAADGYGRMAGKPAVSLLHLGPGFGNGLANIHNGRHAASPMLNIVGDHALSHAIYPQAPLASDIMGICAPVSHWLHRSLSPEAVAGDGARAVAAARAAPGQVATLVLPADCAWGVAGQCAPPIAVAGPAPVPPAAIDHAARALRSGKRTALLMRGRACQAQGAQAAGRIAARSGARLLHDYFSPRVRRGAGLPAIERIPYFAEDIIACLEGLEQIILVGAPPPVTFFAYPGKPSWVTPEGCELITLAEAREDAVAALEALADAIGAPRRIPGAVLARPNMPDGAFTPAAMGAIVARLMPENAIVSDDSLTAGPALDPFLRAGPAHDVLFLTGGAIGDALPMATGAALACPARKVIALSGDGAAMYTLQALWTMARERLDVTTVICANRSYAILNIELGRVGAIAPGAKTKAMIDLSDPAPDWVKLSQGMGVEASRAETPAAFAAQFESAMRARGPRLIEAVFA